MKKILITGSGGAIGWHVRCCVDRQEAWHSIPCDRDQFNSNDYLDNAIINCDAIVHLAGANRGEPEQVAFANRSIADRLIDRLHVTRAKPHVLFSNSIHAETGGSLYGESKKYCSKKISQWANECGAKYANLILPHVFGEHGRPFYNSVVATFAYQLVAGEELEVIEDSSLQLVHAGKVADLFSTCIRDEVHGEVRVPSTILCVTELMEILKNQWEIYSRGEIPPLPCTFQTQLFNTLRSMIPQDKRPISLDIKVDKRGHLFEAVRESSGGQVFYSTTLPGITRGNHYHTRKVERFVVLEGEAEIAIRRMLTDNVVIYRVSGSNPQAIDIPTLHTHNITNVGNSDLKTLFWCNEQFNPEDADTYFCPV